MNIEQIRIREWAQGWNDAMMRRAPDPTRGYSYALGYLDAQR